MDIITLREELKRRGILIHRAPPPYEPPQVVATPKSALTPELRQAIKVNRVALWVESPVLPAPQPAAEKEPESLTLDLGEIPVKKTTQEIIREYRRNRSRA